MIDGVILTSGGTHVSKAATIGAKDARTRTIAPSFLDGHRSLGGTMQ